MRHVGPTWSRSPAAVSILDQVHELAVATSQTASVRVTSYQLAHPENLTASMADLYGIEVEIRLETRPASRIPTGRNPTRPLASAS
jgi:hypothetical protein